MLEVSRRAGKSREGEEESGAAKKPRKSEGELQKKRRRLRKHAEE